MSEYEYSYEGALKAAGFDVIDFQEFGDWSGSWFAFVQLNGIHGFIIDYYGSCSGCDAFQDECEDSPESIKTFGERYKDDLRTFDEALEYARKNNAYDQESNEMIKWVEKHRYKFDFDKMLKE